MYMIMHSYGAYCAHCTPISGVGCGGVGVRGGGGGGQRGRGGRRSGEEGGGGGIITFSESFRCTYKNMSSGCLVDGLSFIRHWTP